MSSAHSVNARKCVHAQKPYPSQAFAHESSKVRGRVKEMKRDRKDRGQETDGKKGSPTKQKHIRGTKTMPTWAQQKCLIVLHECVGEYLCVTSLLRNVIIDFLMVLYFKPEQMPIAYLFINFKSVKEKRKKSRIR